MSATVERNRARDEIAVASLAAVTDLDFVPDEFPQKQMGAMARLIVDQAEAISQLQCQIRQLQDRVD